MVEVRSDNLHVEKGTTAVSQMSHSGRDVSTGHDTSTLLDVPELKQSRD